MTRCVQIAKGIILVASLCTAAIGTPAFAQFETRSSASTGSYVPISLAVGDFNRDGKLDVAVVTYLPIGNVMILLGNGDGTFRTGASYAVAVQPQYAAAASFRNNGTLDLVVGDSLSNDIYVVLGNGDGTFQLPVAYPTSGMPIQVSTGDFTRDGRIDVITLDDASDCFCIEVLPGNGDGTFGAPVTIPVPYNIGGYAMATGYFNEDDDLDVAVAGAFGSANQVDILLGNGDGSFRADGYYPTALAGPSIVGAHFSGSKKIDLAVANGSSIGVLFGNSNSTFQQAVDYPTWSPSGLAAGDVNGDGKEDLVVGNFGSPNNGASSVSVLLGNGDGTFQPEVVYPVGQGVGYVAIGDFNGDHRPDLVVVDSTSGAVIALLNTGVVSFSPTAPLTFVAQVLDTSSAPQTVTLTNRGATALTISSISQQGAGQFSHSTTCGKSVAPGGNCSITLRSTPTVENGTSGTITIRDSASSKPQVIELFGSGTLVKLEPQSLTFPPQGVATKSKAQLVRLTNTSSAPLVFSQRITINGPAYDTFFESNDCPSTLAAGAGCNISVVFEPEQKGPLTDSLIITDNGGGSPQIVPLSGTGD